MKENVLGIEPLRQACAALIAIGVVEGWQSYCQKPAHPVSFDKLRMTGGVETPKIVLENEWV